MANQLALKQDALNRLMQIAATSFGGVAAVRGLSHLVGASPTRDSYLSHPTTTVLPLKVPVRRRQPQPDSFAQSMAKGADVRSALAGMGNTVTKTLDSIKQHALAARDSVASSLPDIKTTHPLMNTWGVPAMGAAAIGGAYGGLRLADGIAQKRQRAVVQGSLEDAKREYLQELRRQYSRNIKSGEAATEVPEAPPKEASINDVLGGMGGAAALALSIPAVASAVGAYRLAKSHSQPRALQKAIELRRRALQGQGPSLYAIADAGLLPEHTGAA